MSGCILSSWLKCSIFFKEFSDLPGCGIVVCDSFLFTSPEASKIPTTPLMSMVLVMVSQFIVEVPPYEAITRCEEKCPVCIDFFSCYNPVRRVLAVDIQSINSYGQQIL